MRQPILVLQYPEPRDGRTIALASTKDWAAMVAFKRAALKEEKLAALKWDSDELLRIQPKTEVSRLETLLGVLVPEDDGADADWESSE